MIELSMDAMRFTNNDNTTKIKNKNRNKRQNT